MRVALDAEVDGDGAPVVVIAGAEAHGLPADEPGTFDGEGSNAPPHAPIANAPIAAIAL